MRWDHPVEKNPTPGNSALFAADAVTTRTFDAPGFRGVTFHEIRARSILNRVSGASRMPCEWL
ncbi:radical SAM protein, partial [Streptomyces sp. NPDC059346]